MVAETAGSVGIAVVDLLAPVLADGNSVEGKPALVVLGAVASFAAGAEKPGEQG